MSPLHKARQVAPNQSADMSAHSKSTAPPFNANDLTDTFRCKVPIQNSHTHAIFKNFTHFQSPKRGGNLPAYVQRPNTIHPPRKTPRAPM